jgi:transcriptional regulator with XRE-family HTH domain
MGVGYKIRKLRNKTKYSQSDIADFLGIDRNTYANWESEANDIKSEYIPKLAQIFDVEIKDLFEDSVQKIEINQTNSENKDSSINGLVFILSDKESIEKLVDVLKKNIK